MYDLEMPFDYPGSQPVRMCDPCGLRVAEYDQYCVRCWEDSWCAQCGEHGHTDDDPHGPDEPEEPFEDPFYRTNHYDITKTRP